jgi:hypothetical protein
VSGFEVGPPAPVEREIVPEVSPERAAAAAEERDAAFEEMMRKVAERADLKMRQERSRRGVRVYTAAERAAMQRRLAGDPLVRALENEFSVPWYERHRYGIPLDPLEPSEELMRRVDAIVAAEMSAEA